MSHDGIWQAIYDNDLPGVTALLRTDKSIASSPIGKPRLFGGKILHWIYSGDTPLHLAAAGHRVAIVKMLLANGVDPNAAMNHRCGAPLHYASDTCLTNKSWSAREQVETIQCLLAAGAKINSQDKNGATPLHRAVRTRGAEAVACLLHAGCDPLLKNKSGSMPFHLAVQNTGRGGSGTDAATAAQLQIIRQFLSFGLSPNSKDGRGKTASNVREAIGFARPFAPESIKHADTTRCRFAPIPRGFARVESPAAPASPPLVRG